MKTSTIKTLSTAWVPLITVSLWALPLPLFAQGLRSLDSGATQGATSSFDPQQGRKIGAPQVLEIPIQEVSPSSNDVSQKAPFPEQTPDDVYHDGLQQAEVPSGLPDSTQVSPSPKRTYLGVLYATAEQGPEGVKVLSIVEGSPAARAGFQGANAPPSEQSSLLKAAIVVLAMSPAGPFAIPLAIAHDMYTNRHAPGDLIVAIDDQPVRNAQEFSEVMHRYQPGDNVSFSIIRAGKPMRLSVQLEEEPL